MDNFSLIKRCSNCKETKAVFSVDMGGYMKPLCAECYKLLIEQSKGPVLENKLTQELRKILKELEAKFGKEELLRIINYTMEKYKDW